MAAPFLRQVYVSGAVPLAAMVNVALCPAVTVWLAGCMVTEGATGLLPPVVPVVTPAQPADAIATATTSAAAKVAAKVDWCILPALAFRKNLCEPPRIFRAT